MTAKPNSLAFHPAPRPQPRVSPEQTRELTEATRDLGFGRTTSAPDAEEPAGATAAPNAAIAHEVLAPRGAPTTSQVSAAAKPPPLAGSSEPSTERQATLKVAMADETWTALRHEALNRRVTVKYLVMEALAAKGYAVDLSKVAEDGRRLR